MKLSESTLRDKIDFKTFYGRGIENIMYCRGIDPSRTKFITTLYRQLARVHNRLWNKARFQSQK